jgi:arginine-tRNA-protein transferase
MIPPREITSNNITLKLGTFFQKYFLDGKLIACAGVDIVESGLMSRYFFYEPDFKSLSIAIIGCIQEIEFIKTFHKEFPNFKYWNPLEYRPRDKKMAYKADFTPAEVICEDPTIWIPFTAQLKTRIDNGEITF